MPFIPHTQEDIQSMLKTIGVDSINTLFDEIPDILKTTADLNALPTGKTEMQVARLMQARADQDSGLACYVGAGAYEHHIPAAVWEVTTRGEYYTAYTPYQAEASQGTLQLLYEYQTMMAQLTGLDVSNASLYDGATALAEAVLMAVRIHPSKKLKSVLLPQTLHPMYRKVVKTIVGQQGISVTEVAFSSTTGRIEQEQLDAISTEHCAFVIPYPNFFGVLERVDELTDWAHAKGMLAIAVANPTSLALLKPPGEWGINGADIACGEGQPLGIPLVSGGPYFGYITCKQSFIRQMPGRIIGRTTDAQGREGFTLTLQAREQHIRRAKATSNICTNQGLMVTAATIYMSLLGAEGLKAVAEQSHINTFNLRERLCNIDGIDPVFDAPFFHEMVIRLSQPVSDILKEMTAQGFLAGYPLGDEYPELDNCLLICATETKTEEDLAHYANALAICMQKNRSLQKTC